MIVPIQTPRNKAKLFAAGIPASMPLKPDTSRQQGAPLLIAEPELLR